MLLVMGVMQAGGPAVRRHRVESARMPGMATGESLQCEPDAVKRTEAAHRGERVIRARRIKAARRTEQRAHGPLIHSDEHLDRERHGISTYIHTVVRQSAPCEVTS